jgi:hypothetical protein
MQQGLWMPFLSRVLLSTSLASVGQSSGMNSHFFLMAWFLRENHVRAYIYHVENLSNFYFYSIKILLFSHKKLNLNPLFCKSEFVQIIIVFRTFFLFTLWVATFFSSYLDRGWNFEFDHMSEYDNDVASFRDNQV